MEDQPVPPGEHQTSWHAVASVGEGTRGQSQSPRLTAARLGEVKGWVVWSDKELGEKWKGFLKARGHQAAPPVSQGGLLTVGCSSKRDGDRR